MNFKIKSNFFFLKYVVAVNKSNDEHRDTSCDAIRKRAYYPTEPFSSVEKNFPIAFIRIVYKVRHGLKVLYYLWFSLNKDISYTSSLLLTISDIFSFILPNVICCRIFICKNFYST